MWQERGSQSQNDIKKLRREREARESHKFKFIRHSYSHILYLSILFSNISVVLHILIWISLLSCANWKCWMKNLLPTYENISTILNERVATDFDFFLTLSIFLLPYCSHILLSAHSLSMQQFLVKCWIIYI